MIGFTDVGKMIGLPLLVAGFTIIGVLLAKAAAVDPNVGVAGGLAVGLGLDFLFLVISQEIHDICGRKN